MNLLQISRSLRSFLVNVPLPRRSSVDVLGHRRIRVTLDSNELTTTRPANVPYNNGDLAASGTVFLAKDSSMALGQFIALFGLRDACSIPVTQFCCLSRMR